MTATPQNLTARRSSSATSGAFDIESAPGWLLLIARVSCLVAVLAAPWFFGCVRYKEQVWLYGVLTLSLVFTLLVILIRTYKTPTSSSLRIPWILLPMIAFVGLGAAQLLPIQQTLTGSHVAQSAELAEFDLGEPIRSNRLSFYPLATKREIARYAFGVVAFLIGYSVFRTPGSQRWLWTLLLINGLALVVFGLIQQSTWNGKLFWSVPLEHGGDPFASFVNRNNFVSHIYAPMAAGIGLFVWALEKSPVRATKNALASLFARISNIDGLQICLSLSLILLATGVVACRSRGGALAFGIAFLLVVVFATFRRRSVWPLLLSAVVIGVSAATVFGLEVDAGLRERFAKVEVSEDAVQERFRVRHWRDALNVTAQLPYVGSGLGTHRYAYLPFVSESGRPWAVNADNQYVELAVETGLCGLVLVLLGLLLAARLIWAGRDCSIESAGTATAVLFLVLAQCGHAVFDFGIIMPATLTGCALFLGAAAASLGARTGGRGVSLWAGRTGLAGFTLAMLAVCFVGTSLTAEASKTAESLALAKTPANLSQERLDSLIAELGAMPDAEAQLSAAALLVARVERVSAGKVRAVAPSLKPEQIQSLSSLRHLSITIQQLARRGQRDQMEAMLSSENIKADLSQAYSHANISSSRCSVLPGAEVLAGRLAAIVGTPRRALAHNRRAVLLEPFNPRATRKAGMNLHAGGANPELSSAILRQSVASRDWRETTKTLKLLHQHFRMNSVIAQVTPTSGVGAIRMSQSLQRAGFAEYRDLVLRQGLGASSEQIDPMEIIARAEIYRLLGESSQALTTLKEAVSLFPGDAEVHYQLAQALLNDSQPGAALAEARVAAGLEPSEAAYRKLVEKISTQARGGDVDLGTQIVVSRQHALT